MRPHLLTAVLLLTASTTGCVTLDEDAWTLRLTREAFAEGEHGWFGSLPDGLDPVYYGNSSAELLVPGVLFLFAAAPVIVDLVCLPITLPHDWIVGRS